MTMTLIETVTLTSAASSIEFTSIPQDGVDLLLVVNARETASQNFTDIQLKFNGSSANLSAIKLNGTGSGVQSTSVLNRIYAGLVGSLATADTFSNASLYISNYTSAVAKSWSADSVSENNATASGQAIVAGLFNSTSAVTTLSIEGSGSLVAGSTASLYKIS